MAGGTNKLSDTSLRKMLGREIDRDRFYADGDGLSIKVSKIGVLTWYFSFRIGGVNRIHSVLSLETTRIFL